MKLYMWKSFDLQGIIEVSCDVGFFEYDDVYKNTLELASALREA